MDKGLSYLINERGLTVDTIVEFGLEYDSSRDAIRIPYFDGMGRERGARYRLLSPPAGRGKYWAPKGSQLHLYNVADVEASFVYIAEGELDTLTLKQYGLAAVGLPGASSFREDWKWLFSGSHVTIVIDADHDGLEKARRISRWIRRYTPETWIKLPPIGEDINSLHVQGKLEDFLNGIDPENS